MKKLLALSLALCLTLCAAPSLAESIGDALILPSGGTQATPDPSVIDSLLQGIEQTYYPAGTIPVYQNPNTSSSILGTLSPDQPFVVHEVQGDWFKIAFQRTYGWILGSSLTQTPGGAIGAQYYVVNPMPTQRLNLRVTPSTAAESLGKYYSGTPVQATGAPQNGWMPVKIGTTAGWMRADYLTQSSMAVGSAAMPTVTVANGSGSGLNLRTQPNTRASILGLYPNGTSVVVLGVRSDGWYHVMVQNKIGYMMASKLSQTFPYNQMTDSDSSAADAPGSSATVMAVSNPNPADRLNLREKPSRSSASLGRYYNGTSVDVQSISSDGWAYVVIGPMAGYMDASYLGEVGSVSSADIHAVITNRYGSGLNLRETPSLSAVILGLYPNGTDVLILGMLPSGWTHVMVGGRMGFMQSERLSMVANRSMTLDDGQEY